MHQEVESGTTTQVSSPVTSTPAPVKKTKVKTKKAVKKAVKAAKTAKVEKVPAEKKIRVIIDHKALTVPKGAEIKILGTCVKFSGKNGHGYLKGRRIEISNADVAGLKDRLDLITKKDAEKYHLGKSKAFIKVTDTADVQAVLDIYLG